MGQGSESLGELYDHYDEDDCPYSTRCIDCMYFDDCKLPKKQRLKAKATRRKKSRRRSRYL